MWPDVGPVRGISKFEWRKTEAILPERLEPLEFTAQGDRVTVEGKNRGTVKSTGRAYEHDWVMVFTLREGKIKRLLHYYDTADIVAAFRGK